MKVLKLDIISLAKILVKEHGANSPLRLQKLLFFFHYEMLKDKKEIENLTFEAWIHGPVCPKVYQEFKSYFYDEEEKEWLFEIDKATKAKVKTLNLKEKLKKYEEMSTSDLKKHSHENFGWIAARRRSNVEALEPSTEELKNIEIIN